MGTIRSVARKPKNTGAEAPEYVLGTSGNEVARLGLQHRLWAASAHQLWERCAIRPGMTVLDAGCGPGHATMDLAEIVGNEGRVLAVDESPAFLKQLNEEARARGLNHVDRVLGDVQDLDKCIPDADSFVDMAYARWVLCFVPRPEDVIKGVARLLRPGGRFAIQDYFNYETMTVAPKSAIFSKTIAAIGQSWRHSGGDPDIVGRLPGMLRAHGFEVSYLNVNPRLARPGDTMWHWPDSFWSSFVPRLVKLGFITEEDKREFFDHWRKISSDPDAFMQLPLVYDIVATKK